MRYSTRLLASALVAAVAYFALALSLAPALISAEYWVREMLVIKRSLAQRYRGQTKIIVASGSGTLFGVDTRQLTDALKVPVINYGFHAGLGLDAIVREAAAVAERGDTIILPLEPPYYTSTAQTGWQARNTLAWDPERWRAAPLPDKVRGISLLGPLALGELAAARIQGALLPRSLESRQASLDDRGVLARFVAAPAPATFAYSAYHLDDLGNMRRTEGSRYLGTPRWSPEDETIICPESWEILRSFTAGMAREGVAVYFANIPYVATPRLDREKIRDSSRRLANELSRLAPVLDEREQLVLERRLFFNTDLHLNAEGRRLRTDLLLQALRRKGFTAPAPP